MPFLLITNTVPVCSVALAEFEVEEDSEGDDGVPCVDLVTARLRSSIAMTGL